MTDTLIVYGSGGHAKVVVEAALAVSPNRSIILIDDNPEAHGTKVLGCIVVGGRERLSPQAGDVAVALGIGGNAARADILQWLTDAGSRLETVIHPSATVSPSAMIGEGVFIAAKAVVIAEAIIGRGVIINTAASVDHDCRIGEAAHIAPGAHLCGNVSVGARSLVGVGTAVSPGVSIGDDVIVGAGSAVVRDLPSGGRFGGCPARALREDSGRQ